MRTFKLLAILFLFVAQVASKSYAQPAGEIQTATPVLFLTAAQIKAFAIRKSGSPTKNALERASKNIGF